MGPSKNLLMESSSLFQAKMTDLLLPQSRKSIYAIASICIEICRDFSLFQAKFDNLLLPQLRNSTQFKTPHVCMRTCRDTTLIYSQNGSNFSTFSYRNFGKSYSNGIQHPQHHYREPCGDFKQFRIYSYRAFSCISHIARAQALFFVGGNCYGF